MATRYKKLVESVINKVWEETQITVRVTIHREEDLRDVVDLLNREYVLGSGTWRQVDLDKTGPYQVIELLFTTNKNRDSVEDFAKKMKQEIEKVCKWGVDYVVV